MNMFRKRGRMEIICSMLTTIREYNPGALSTHVMYKSNLSHELHKRYLKVLVDNELVREKNVDKKKVYDITEKGEKFIETYECLRSMLRVGLNANSF